MKKRKDAQTDEVVPIFILGRGHSGTTILYNMLALHPDSAWFSQYSQRDGKIPGRSFLPFHSISNRALRVLSMHSWMKRGENRFLAFLLPKPREARLIWKYTLPEGDAAKSREQVIHRLRTVVASEARDWGRRHVVFKNPLISSDVALLHQAFPQGVFIHIVRDGRAVALSIGRKRKHAHGGESREALLRRLAEHWQQVVRQVHAAGSEMERFMEIKYEVFCTDIHGYLSRVLDLAGLSTAKMPWHRVPATLKPTNERWLNSCPEQERLLLEGIIGKTLREFGYA